jgi:uncharacterized protein DUF4939
VLSEETDTTTNPSSSLFSSYRENELTDNETTTEEEPSTRTEPHTPTSEPEMADSMTKEIGIQKPSDFDGDRKKMQSFVLQCKAYLTINGHIYKTDASKIAFILSFLNEKEAEAWRENYFLSIMKDGDLIFPTLKEFMEKFEEGFKPINRSKDAIHKINVLRQGKKTAEEIVTEFRLLSNQAGYTVSSPADHLHLIDRLQSVLNPSLVRKVLLSPDVPTTIDAWANRAMTIDTTYRQTNEVMERLLGDKKGSKTSQTYSRPSSSNNNNWRKKKEEKDPDAMDVDAMSTEKRAYLMKKGACFKCEKTGHLAKDHDEFVKKEEDKKKKGKETPKKDLKAIHALFSGLSKAEKEELLAMSKGDNEEDEEEEEEETDKKDF